MQPFHKILVPTDFSPHSAEAIRVAASLSRTFAAPLTVMTVYQPAVVPMVPDGVMFPVPVDMEAEVAQMKAKLHELELEATAAGADASAVSSELRQGAPFDEIIANAKEGAFDLIVMGTHGHTGLKHVLLGSVTEKVVREAPCAVLTVRLPEEEAE